MKIHNLLLVFTLCFCITSFAQRGSFDDVEYAVTDLGNGIYMLEGSGGNIGLSIGEDGAFLIDDQYAPLTPKLLGAIRELTEAPVKYVLNTHWHGDHTGGNENLAKTGAVIVAHDNVRSRMAAPGQRQSPQQALPVITFSDTHTHYLNGLQIQATHVAGAHTDGDVLVNFVGTNVIHAGDILFNGIYPFIDLDSGGSVDGYIAAMEKLAAMANADTKIIAGHGPLATRQDVEKSIAMVKEAKRRVARLVEEKKTLEEVQQMDPLADLNEKWSWSFITGERFTQILYKDISGN